MGEITILGVVKFEKKKISKSDSSTDKVNKKKPLTYPKVTKIIYFPLCVKLIKWY